MVSPEVNLSVKYFLGLLLILLRIATLRGSGKIMEQDPFKDTQTA
jgi:hypothetical protein